MNVYLVVGYYLIVLVGIAVYVSGRPKRLCMSDFIMIGITVLFDLAGVFIAFGIPYGYVKLDFSLFILYSSFSILVPLGLRMGNKVYIPRRRLYDKCVNDGLLFFLIIFILLYAIGFFIIIRNNIPLIMLLSGESASTIKVARLQITHNLTKYYSVPFIFRYNNLIFDYVSLYVYAILLVKYLNNKSRYKLMFWTFVPIEVFLSFYSTEKAPMVYLFITTIYCIYEVGRYRRVHSGIPLKALDDKHLKKKIRFYSVIGAIGFLFLYTAFMGLGSDVKSGYGSLLSRAFVTQSSSVYLQKIILDNEYGGCLFGKGMPLMIFDSLLGRTTVNLSSSVYSNLYSSYTSLGGSGTTGSVAIFDMYANFGMIAAIIIVFIVAMVTGIVDSHMSEVIDNSQVNELSIGFKAILIIVFFQGYLGHFQTFFMLPFIVSPQLIVIIALTWAFRHMRLGKKGR